MIKPITSLIVLLGMGAQVFAQEPIAYIKKKLIFSDDFSHGMNPDFWHAEFPAGIENRVYVSDGRLWLDTKDGVTVWYKQLLKGNYCIEYTRTVLLDTGKNDRLSDLNNFWQATDPKNQNLFTRNGELASYDSLRLYYAGIGAGHNQHSRFRKYPGTGERTLLKEYTDSLHLLQPNRPYKITIVFKTETTQLLVDGKVWFRYTDPKPLPAGYFGLRSTKSRQWVDDVKIWEIE